MEVKYSFFEYDQNKLYYGIVGEGFPVLLLHGWPQTSYMWRHLYPYLVKNRFKCNYARFTWAWKIFCS